MFNVAVAASGTNVIQPALGVRWKITSITTDINAGADLFLILYNPSLEVDGAAIGAGKTLLLGNMIIDNANYIAIGNTGTVTENAMVCGIEVA